jgi:protoporphyrinogen oxidase
MDLIKEKTNILIGGAGIAGCAAAQMLQANEMDYLLIEKNIDPGGLTRSISLGDAHFDYTGHYLHLSKCKSPSTLPFANQNDNDWRLVKRKSKVYLDNEIIPAPFQYNLFYLSSDARKRCIETFYSRPKFEQITSFREYLLAGFGEGICDYFLFPYNEKIMACSLSDLSVDSVKRFFPMPEKEMIEQGFIKEGINLETGYNSWFWYPKQQGIGILAQGLAKDLNALQTCCSIEEIDLSSKCIYTRLGKVSYEKFLTSLPLKAFCNLTSDSLLQNLASSLRHTRVFCLNLLIKSQVPEIFEDCHWIYIPDKCIPFYRFGVYSHISSEMNPRGTTALYVETAFSDKSPLPDMIRLLDDVLSTLERLGWISKSDCLVVSANWIDFAYVLFDHSREKIVKEILEILQHYDVYPIGRYGLWDYISMEDTILRSIETARMVMI